MFKFLFGTVIVVFFFGVAFWLGFVLGSTMTPLSTDEPMPTPSSSAPAAVVIHHG